MRIFFSLLFILFTTSSFAVTFDGKFIQGSFILGKTEPGSEVFIDKKDFEKLKNKFSNPRNAASGTLRQKDSKQTSKIPLKFIAYTFGYISDNKFKKQSDFLKELKSWGFLTSEHNKVFNNILDLLKFHKEFENKRYNPNETLKWYYTPKKIKNIILNDMLCDDPNDRKTALDILTNYNNVIF